MVTYYYFTVILSNCLLLIAFIVGFSNKQLIKNKQIRWFLFYLGFVLFTEIINKTFIYILNIKDTSFTYPLYVAGEFFILAHMLLNALGYSKKRRFIVGFVSILLFIEAAYLWYNNESFNPGIGKIFSHITIVVMAALVLIKRLKEIEIKSPFLTVYAALFLYYAVSLFLFLLLNQLTESTIIIWIMNNILASVLYGSSLYAFHQLKKGTHSNS